MHGFSFEGWARAWVGRYVLLQWELGAPVLVAQVLLGVPTFMQDEWGGLPCAGCQNPISGLTLSLIVMWMPFCVGLVVIVVSFLQWPLLWVSAATNPPSSVCIMGLHMLLAGVL